jgi:DNA-binding MurR/RpiR family transcriptional regulator
MVRGVSRLDAGGARAEHTFDRGLAGLNTALAANYDRLAPAQRLVIDHLVQDKRYGAITSLPEIARALNVSESTVTRAAQVLGFKGFPDLQSRIREHFAGGVADRLDVIASELSDTPAGTVVQVILEDASAVRRAAEDIDMDAIDKALEALLRARRVYIFGMGGSHGLAQILGVGLRLALSDVRVVGGDGEGLADQLLGLEASDVLVAISFRRLDVAALRAVEWAGRIGGNTIVLTDAPASRLARSSSIVLALPAGRLRLAPSYACGSSLVNGLVTAVGLATRDRSRSQQLRWETLRRHFHEIYSPDSGSLVQSRERRLDGTARAQERRAR